MSYELIPFVGNQRSLDKCFSNELRVLGSCHGATDAQFNLSVLGEAIHEVIRWSNSLSLEDEYLVDEPLERGIIPDFSVRNRLTIAQRSLADSATK